MAIPGSRRSGPREPPTDTGAGIGEVLSSVLEFLGQTEIGRAFTSVGEQLDPVASTIQDIAGLLPSEMPIPGPGASTVQLPMLGNEATISPRGIAETILPQSGLEVMLELVTAGAFSGPKAAAKVGAKAATKTAPVAPIASQLRPLSNPTVSPFVGPPRPTTPGVPGPEGQLSFPFKGAPFETIEPPIPATIEPGTLEAIVSKPNRRGATYFHGTNPARAEEIIEEGFQSGSSAALDLPGTSLSRDPNVSLHRFAQDEPSGLLVVEVPPNLLSQTLDMRPSEFSDTLKTLRDSPDTPAYNKPSTFYKELETFVRRANLADETGQLGLFRPTDFLKARRPTRSELDTAQKTVANVEIALDRMTGLGDNRISRPGLRPRGGESLRPVILNPLNTEVTPIAVSGTFKRLAGAGSNTQRAELFRHSSRIQHRVRNAMTDTFRHGDVNIRSQTGIETSSPNIDSPIRMDYGFPWRIEPDFESGFRDDVRRVVKEAGLYGENRPMFRLTATDNGWELQQWNIGVHTGATNVDKYVPSSKATRDVVEPLFRRELATHLAKLSPEARRFFNQWTSSRGVRTMRFLDESQENAALIYDQISTGSRISTMTRVREAGIDLQEVLLRPNQEDLTKLHSNMKDYSENFKHAIDLEFRTTGDQPIMQSTINRHNRAPSGREEPITMFLSNPEIVKEVAKSGSINGAKVLRLLKSQIDTTLPKALREREAIMLRMDQL